MYTTDEFVEEWIRVNPKDDPSHRKYSYWRVEDNGYTLRNWSQTRPVALKSRTGQFGCGVKLLLNGDVTRGNGYGHPAPVAEVLGHLRGRKVPNVQIPFSALESAKVSPYSLRIVDYRDDKFWEECKFCGKEVKTTKSYDYYKSFLPGDRYDNHVHVDGSEICNAEITEAMVDECAKKYRTMRELFTRHNHSLGAVVFRDGNRYYLSSIDDNERRYRNYFLCWLPKKVKTIQEAFDSLVPKMVRQVQDCGAKVDRQGEIFFIPTSFKPTREQADHEMWTYHRLFNGSHVATKAMRVRDLTYVSGKISHEPTDRWRQRMHSPYFCYGKWFLVVKGLAKGSWEAQGYVD